MRVFEYNASGDPTGELVKQGSSGTAYYVAATDYLGGTNENRKHLVTARYVYPQAETSRTAASRIATTFEHTFWTDSDTVQMRTTTLPAVASGENGSDSSTTLVEYYDARGRLRWQKDAAGAVSYFSYHPEHGHLAYAVRDADPSSLPASADNNESKWVEPDDGFPSSNQPTRGRPAHGRRTGHLVRVRQPRPPDAGRQRKRNRRLHPGPALHALRDPPSLAVSLLGHLHQPAAIADRSDGLRRRRHRDRPVRRGPRTHGAERRRAHRPCGRHISEPLPALESPSLR